MEIQEYRRSLRRLQEMGIQVGSDGDFVNQPPWLNIEQVDTELASFYEYPGNMVAVRLFAKLTVMRPGSIITDVEIGPTWNCVPLHLTGAESAFYKDLLKGLPAYPPNILNGLLTHHEPLRPRQEEGLILAHGWTEVPLAVRDHSPIIIDLSLVDQRGGEISFEFQATLDRAARQRYEDEKFERAARTPSRQPIFVHTDRGSTDREEVSRPNATKETTETRADPGNLPANEESGT